MCFDFSRHARPHAQWSKWHHMISGLPGPLAHVHAQCGDSELLRVVCWHTGTEKEQQDGTLSARILPTYVSTSPCTESRERG